MMNSRSTCLYLIALVLGTGCVSKSVYLKEEARANQLKTESENQAELIQTLQENAAETTAENQDLLALLQTAHPPLHGTWALVADVTRAPVNYANKTLIVDGRIAHGVYEQKDYSMFVLLPLTDKSIMLPCYYPNKKLLSAARKALASATASVVLEGKLVQVDKDLASKLQRNSPIGYAFQVTQVLK